MSGLFNVLTDSLVKYLQGTFIYYHNLFTIMYANTYQYLCYILYYSKV